VADRDQPAADQPNNLAEAHPPLYYWYLHLVDVAIIIPCVVQAN
jgi:hypothetical protein